MVFSLVPLWAALSSTMCLVPSPSSPSPTMPVSILSRVMISSGNPWPHLGKYPFFKHLLHHCLDWSRPDLLALLSYCRLPCHSCRRELDYDWYSLSFSLIPLEETKVFVTDWRRILLRLGCLLVVCFIGYIFPQFDNVVSFNILYAYSWISWFLYSDVLGCFTVSAVSFILPFVIHYILTPQITKKDKVIDIIMIICGFIIMIVSTACCFF